MCMEDVDIGRATKTQLHFTVGSLEIPGRASRLSVRILCDDNDQGFLSAIVTPMGTGLGATNFMLAAVSRIATIAAATAYTQYWPQADVNLQNVGNLLLGPLRLISNNSVGVYAIETYLDVQSGPSNNTAIL